MARPSIMSIMLLIPVKQVSHDGLCLRERVFLKFLAAAECACFNLMFEKCLLLLNIILEMWIILLGYLRLLIHLTMHARTYTVPAHDLFPH